MNLLNQIKAIKEKLINSGYSTVADNILDYQLSGGTPGEVFAGVSFYLNELKNKNKDVYSVISKEADEIISYAKSLNYIQKE
ncbi:MAG: hypothetical protein JWO09_2738 [Bacteroidetes bacterium]|nr:hypothetical protein [Bacteroidota bacterium]